MQEGGASWGVSNLPGRPRSVSPARFGRRFQQPLPSFLGTTALLAALLGIRGEGMEPPGSGIKALAGGGSEAAQRREFPLGA